MAFASDQQHGAVVQALDGRADRFAAVSDFLRAARGGEDPAPDRGRVLAARMVGGDDHVVRILDRNLAHDRALTGIAVAAAAKNDRQPSARIGPQSLERLLQRIRLVRVISEYRRTTERAGEFTTALGAL